MKKIISILLTLIMLIGAMATSTVSASGYFETESNNDYNTANILPLNSTITGNMENNYDCDVYKINTNSNGKLSLTFSHRYIDSSYVYWNVTVYKYSNGEYEEIENSKIYGGDNESINLPMIGAVASGIYFVKITTYWNETSGRDYQLTNSFVSGNNYEKEFNEDYYTATTLGLKSSCIGTMNSSNDCDVYKITTNANGKLSLSFNHKYVDSSYVYWNVTVYKYSDGTYNEIAYSKIYGSDNESINLPMIGAVASGIYFVKITTYWNETSGREYILKSSFTATNYYEKELNNDYYSATQMTFGKKYYGNMNSGDDSDYYKLNISSSNYIRIIFSHSYSSSSYVYWYVKLYRYSNGEYKEISSSKVEGNSSDYYLSNGSLSTGTYYIKVSTYWGESVNYTYSISSSTFVPKPAKPTATIKKGKAKFKWTKTYDANGYQVQISRNKNFKKCVVNKHQKKASLTKILARRKTYYIRIRSYKVVNGKTYYSKWTKIKFKTK